MTVQIRQQCDRCKDSRPIDSPGHTKTWGWREVDLGGTVTLDERNVRLNPKPSLCPSCQQAVLRFIAEGVE